MKLMDIKIGGVVYLKKSARARGDRETPRIVIAIEKRKHKFNRIIMEGLPPLNPGELTDTRCSKMKCGKCKYHPVIVKKMACESCTKEMLNHEYTYFCLNKDCKNYSLPIVVNEKRDKLYRGIAKR